MLMKIIVGLGNSGKEYLNTRHNAGYLVAEALQKRISNFQFPISNQKIASLRVKIFKSDKFMNDSGSFVVKLVDKYKLDLSDLYIIHDDLDIPLGAYKIQFGVGPKVHNGVNSVEQELGTKDFWRVRVGVENRTMNNELRIKGEDYVLQDFTDEERRVLDKTIREICSKIITNEHK